MYSIITGALIFALIGVIVLMGLHIFWNFLISYVDDAEYKVPFWDLVGKEEVKLSYNNSHPIYSLLTTGMFTVVALVTVLLWPIVTPILITMGLATGARTFVRFKKKVDKHSHDSEGKVKYNV